MTASRSGVITAMSMLIVGLLGAATGAAGQSEEPSLQPAEVTGTTAFTDDRTPLLDETVGGQRTDGWQRGVMRTGYVWDASDPRLDGRVDAVIDSHTYLSGSESVVASTLSLVNEGGRWAGTSTGYWRAGRNGRPASEGGAVKSETVILTGAGGYAGLTAYLVLDHAQGTLMGMVFPGEMPAGDAEPATAD